MLSPWSEWMSTRLKKRVTISSLHLSGMAARADWVVHRHAILKKYGEHWLPRVIFINMYMANQTFPFFVTTVLPTITAPVVLILASEDCTFPTGTGDTRAGMTPFVHMQALVHTLLTHKLVTRIFVENLDQPHPKLTPLPLGVLPYGPDMRFAPAVQTRTRDASQSLRVLCVHRFHGTDAQWDARRHVSALCTTEWSSFTTVLPSNQSHDHFTHALRTHDFVLCVHGGGIDPSPRAWEALLAGCIPIMTHSALDPAYARFPCVIINAWTPDALSVPKLEAWWQQLRSFYEQWQYRQRILYMLTLDYWWSNVIAACSSETDMSTSVITAVLEAPV